MVEKVVRGGSVIFQATHKVQSLIDLKANKIYKAENGHQGMGKKKSGPAGRDLIVNLPIGTQIYDDDNNLLHDLTKQDDTFIVAQGGKGGQGNSRVKQIASARFGVTNGEPT